jgi:hypothetical protein
MRRTEYPQRGFRKSSHSMPTRGDCVEVCDLPGVSAVRDSRHRDGSALHFPAGEWRAALASVVAQPPKPVRLQMVAPITPPTIGPTTGIQE